MATLKYSTNLKCNGCVNAIRESLDKLDYIEVWNVDLESESKILTITTKEEGKHISQSIIELIKEAGYIANRI